MELNADFACKTSQKKTPLARISLHAHCAVPSMQYAHILVETEHPSDNGGSGKIIW